MINTVGWEDNMLSVVFLQAGWLWAGKLKVCGTNSTKESFFKSGILLQQPLAPLEGVFAHFSVEYLLYWHHPERNERAGDIPSTWVDVTTAVGAILRKFGRATKMAVSWSYFRDFVRAQKIENLSESKTFFVEVFQITRRFVLAKKFGGLGAPQC